MPRIAWWLRRQSRRIFQPFMRAKACSTRHGLCGASDCAAPSTTASGHGRYTAAADKGSQQEQGDNQEELERPVLAQRFMTYRRTRE